jgi:tetratricopeptide (TPR) repeat protein
LDGADLRGANLSFTSLRGASLRGANLEGSILHGTDLRYADLSGASLSPNALEQAHWSGTTGLPADAQSHAALHNAGVTAAESDRWKEAEELFGLAIRKQPDSPESWVARGIAREQLGQREPAIQDFSYASNIYKADGLITNAEQLQAAALSMQNKVTKDQGGNGVGSALLGGLLSTSKALMPLAMKLFMPVLGI